MAVARVSPRYPYSVRSMSKGSQNELWAYTGRARYPDDSEVGGILQTAHPGQIGCTVATPVTQKRRDLGFPLIHSHLLLTGYLTRKFEARNPKLSFGHPTQSGGSPLSKQMRKSNFQMTKTARFFLKEQIQFRSFEFWKFGHCFGFRIYIMIFMASSGRDDVSGREKHK